MAVRMDYSLTGIKCANCARKIEINIQRLDEVEEAGLNFALQKLSVSISEGSLINELETKIQRIMDTIEPGSKLVKERYPEIPAGVSVSEEQTRKSLDLSDNTSASNNEENESQCRTSCCGKKESHNDEHVGDDGERGLSQLRISFYAAAFLTYFIGFFAVSDQSVRLVLFIAVFLVFGAEVLQKSVRNILRGQFFDENFLMSIASIGAFIVGQHPEAAAVMMFYQIGEMFQELALNHSRKSIKSLLAIKPDYANLKSGEGFVRVNPSSVRTGDHIVIRPGERVPLDGFVVSGSSTLDTSALTGESLPRDIKEGDEILSGSINQSGVLVVQVSKTFGDSTVNRILSLVENASQKKAVTERFITRFASWYTPVVIALAAMLAFVPPLFFSGRLSDWVYRALIFLVLSCPCALVISIPLGFFGGIGAASKRGILVKGGNYLEALAKVNTVVFDKTGTLTEGRFEVSEINAVNGITQEELHCYAAHAEAFSTHPLAQSIIASYKTEIDKGLVADYKEIAGMGVSAKVNGEEVLCGNEKLLERFNIAFSKASGGTLIHVAVNGDYKGFIKLEDTPKPDSHKAVTQLQELGVEDIVMLTGDQKDAARSVAKKLGIGIVYAELLPHQKVEHLERVINERKGLGTVAFVGDGINDAPVLARADIGISMGGAGSDAAIEASDIVIMTDEPCKVAEAVLIARKTKSVVFQNILLAVGVKVLVLFLGAGGLATLWEAVFADVGVALLAILNAMRLIKIRGKN